MRKFLSMFAIISLATPIASNVVACSKVDYRVNNYGNSAYWFLPKLNGAGAHADSSDVWSEMDPFASNSNGDRNSVIKNPAAWNVDQRNALGMKILQMLSAALLINAGNPNQWKENNPFNQLATYFKQNLPGADYSALLNNLKIGWQTLDKSVDQEIANKKQSYKDQYGDNKWQSHWNDMLNDSYDGSEQKYKADLLTSSTTLNASQVLANALLGGTPGFQTIQSNTIQSYAQNYLGATADRTKWITQNPEEARAILLGYQSAISGNTNWESDAENKLPLPTTDQLNSALAGGQGKPLPKTAPTPMQAVPSATYDGKTFVRTQNNYQNIPSTNNGILSQFQNYALNKYYQDEKPLAVSTYQAAYAATPFGQSSTDKGLENGVTDADFGSTLEPLKDGSTLKNINNILDKVDNWNDLTSEAKLATGATYQKKMVTLHPDSSITPEMETAVYGSLSTLVNGYKDLKEGDTTDFNKLPIIQAKYLKDDSSNAKTTSSSLLKAIQRSSKTKATSVQPDSYANSGSAGSGLHIGNNQMYAVVDLGPNPTSGQDSLAVAYLDDKGLELAHVDGLQQAVDSDLTGKTQVDPTSVNAWTSQKQNEDLDNFNYNINNKINNDTKPYDSTNTIGKVTPNTFNNSIYNPYLQYLVNQSYISSAQSSLGTTGRPQFNIMNDLKAFATLDSSSKVGNGLWYTWVYSFFNNLFTKAGDTNWLSNLVNVSPDAPKGKNNTATWFQNFLNNAEGAVQSSGLQNLYKAILTLNKTIKGKDASYNGGLYDKSTINWGDYFTDPTKAPADNPANLPDFWTLDNKWQGGSN